MNFDVVANLSCPLEDIYKASMIVAFIGTRPFIIKSQFHTRDVVPSRPDKVIAFYYNDHTAKELQLRKGTTFGCGHEVTEQNTLIKRFCKCCYQRAQKKYKEKKRNEAKAKNTV